MAMMAAAGGDFKTELNQLLQKSTKRPVTKTDIVYTTSKFGPTQFQSIVKLNILEGQEYAGHLSHDVKSAEKSAAQQALVAHRDQLNLAAAAPSETKKRKPGAQLTPMERAAKKQKAAEGAPEDNPAITPKTQLNSLAMKIVKRFLNKGETVYQTNKVGALYQATVTLACLPGDWAERAWAGHPKSTKQAAEQSAAEEALKDLESDPEMKAEAEVPKGGGKGFGKGKGKGFKGKMMAMMWMKGGWGWGGGGGEMPRERISEDQVIGTILEWKGSYGWVQASTPIDHPASVARGGKIYIHKKDIQGDVETLAQGQSVSFKVYADPSGLGAEEASLC
eukprot:TRINITY_DN3519_c0_g1_i2.p1 TRINITY_DN3519_c0_g1~~TRINITY_DN3519_c0_g1_i2.p1  ORF type:complete len:335 (+),score=100.04 TRINITY_DN3519_c0_g1_i2:85-1089(+)